ncbi:glycosyltransferase family 39 protein [Dactylosporangium sp. CA-092794]|uniref:glycosyltransferase family 39 protein n=1 Tax=Dactylosporangium sp. CA-092794 TaxID=3239929 RepID=UPI003D8A4881
MHRPADQDQRTIAERVVQLTRRARARRIVRSAWSGPVLVASLVLLALMATASRYGYDRDEFYFIVAGGHPAAGYPDQPPLVPLVCWLMHSIAPGSLPMLRLPSALAASATVLASAATAREVSKDAMAPLIAAAVAGVSAISLATGHFVTTTTFDVLSTALLGWLIVRVMMRRSRTALVVAGLVAGIGFEAKPQVGIAAIALLAAVALVGPRWPLRSAQLAVGAGLAIALAAPYLLWQLMHGWPQISVARNIGGDAEGGRAGFIPFQIVLVSPFLVPIIVAGLAVPWRLPAARPLRPIPIAFGLLAVAYIVGNGKAYYLASMYPTIIALGAVATASWISNGRQRLRHAALAAGVVAAGAVNATIALPFLPPDRLDHSVTMGINPDLAEEIGWPDFVRSVSEAWHRIPVADQTNAAIIANNYGEAGAIDVLGPGLGLPHAFSTHNGYSLWGRPTDAQTPLILTGFDEETVNQHFSGCRTVATVTNPDRVHNQEYGGPIFACTGPTVAWSESWPRLRHFD